MTKESLSTFFQRGESNHVSPHSHATPQAFLGGTAGSQIVGNITDHLSGRTSGYVATLPKVGMS
jgi:hypothetical protein